MPPGITTIALQFLLMHSYDIDPDTHIEKALPQMAAHLDQDLTGDNMEDGNFDIGNLAWYENQIVREI